MTYVTKLLSKKEARLQPLRAKSFYGKAKTINQNGTEILQSYQTDVAEYDKATGKVKINGWYSQTTARHINAFLSKHGKPTLSKSEMQKRPIL